VDGTVDDDTITTADAITRTSREKDGSRRRSRDEPELRRV
jgi:hypothetical protein